MKKYKSFRPRVRTKNHTAEELRPKHKALPLLPFKSIVRLGSTTICRDEHERITLNTIESIRNSSHKLRMKEAFVKKDVSQSIWYTISNKKLFINELEADKSDLPFPMLAKKIYGYKGKGMKKIENLEELNTFLSVDTSGYFLEKFYNFGKEYRIHTSLVSDCFYTCRKIRIKDSEEKWFFNSTNCNWLIESNPDFDRPNNWDKIVQHAKNALTSVGLDVGAVDIRIQNNTNSEGEKRNDPQFIVCEINSAPSFGAGTLQKYIEEIPKVLIKKYESNRH